jgi:soluble lytic murein transglycosylase-like protein
VSEAVSESADMRSRRLARSLVLGSLCCVTALMLQTANFGPQRNLSTQRPSMFTRFIDATQRANPQPSVYDVEADMSSTQLLNRWDTVISEASQRFHIPKAWIRAVMRQESGGRTMLGEGKPIVSRAGAIGLMQVMPGTYDQMAERHRLGDNPFDARDNIMAGAAYLRWLHQRYGFPRMFAAYNAGPGRVAQGGRLPAETRAYVGGITKTLKVKSGQDLVKRELVKLTRPDGAAVKIDPVAVTEVRVPLPGEYDWSVKAVLTLNHKKQQAVRENVTIALSAIRATGGVI